MRHTTDATQTPSSGKPTLVKTTLNLPADEFAALKQLAVTRHASVSDVVRRAVVLEKLLHDALRNGGKILLEEPDQPIKQLIIR
ncbi:MAG: CopG family transcriptional regulator [Acidobacteriota bacterium]